MRAEAAAEGRAGDAGKDESLTEEELEAEAHWVYENAFAEERHRGVSVRPKDVLLGGIIYVLRCLRVEKMEVPYILTYRRDFWQNVGNAGRSRETSLLDDDVWAIDDWYEAFHTISKHILHQPQLSCPILSDPILCYPMITHPNFPHLISSHLL